jgi:hypothetical protein
MKDRFSSIVAKLYVDSNSVIISNTEGNTERVIPSRNLIE